ncbi:MAG: hypothetical protein ABJE10_20525 [bacterium]
MIEIATALSAARAADHSAAPSPSFGDSAPTQLSRLTLTNAAPITPGKVTRAVEFLRFIISPASVSDIHLHSLSGAT